MAGEPPVLTPVRFGPFELFVESGELRKNGVRLKVSGQPIQVLSTLVASPGRLVTREELQHQLWPASSFGDFEKGLNAAVNRLRENLNDSAHDPKYIETIPGRGYRFIGTVETLPSGTLESSTAGDKQPLPERPTSHSKYLGWYVVLIALAVVAVAGVIVMRVKVRSPQPMIEKRITANSPGPVESTSLGPDRYFDGDRNRPGAAPTRSLFTSGPRPHRNSFPLSRFGHFPDFVHFRPSAS